MKKGLIFTLFAFSTALLTAQSAIMLSPKASTGIPTSLEMAIGKGDVPAIERYLASQVDISIDGKKESLSKSAASERLREFYKTHPAYGYYDWDKYEAYRDDVTASVNRRTITVEESQPVVSEPVEKDPIITQTQIMTQDQITVEDQIVVEDRDTVVTEHIVIEDEPAIIAPETVVTTIETEHVIMEDETTLVSRDTIDADTIVLGKINEPQSAVVTRETVVTEQTTVYNVYAIPNQADAYYVLRSSGEISMPEGQNSQSGLLMTRDGSGYEVTIGYTGSAHKKLVRSLTIQHLIADTSMK